jgi:Putative transposase of IS4/5 family (DUF4096)
VPAARPVGRARTTDLRAVLNAIFYLLRTGCQWRLLAREFPPCEFLALHPDLEMEVILDDRVIDLVEEGTDASLRMGTVADSTMDHPQAGVGPTFGGGDACLSRAGR